MCVCVCVCVCSCCLSVVEGDPKGLFSIATTPRRKGGRYSFPRLLHLPLNYTLQCWMFRSSDKSNPYISWTLLCVNIILLVEC